MTGQILYKHKCFLRCVGSSAHQSNMLKLVLSIKCKHQPKPRLKRQWQNGLARADLYSPAIHRFDNIQIVDFRFEIKMIKIK